jgi:hypothetical protein
LRHAKIAANRFGKHLATQGKRPVDKPQHLIGVDVVSVIFLFQLVVLVVVVVVVLVVIRSSGLFFM